MEDLVIVGNFYEKSTGSRKRFGLGSFTPNME